MLIRQKVLSSAPAVKIMLRFCVIASDRTERRQLPKRNVYACASEKRHFVLKSRGQHMLNALSEFADSNGKLYSRKAVHTQSAPLQGNGFLPKVHLESPIMMRMKLMYIQNVSPGKHSVNAVTSTRFIDTSGLQCFQDGSAPAKICDLMGHRFMVNSEEVTGG